MIQESDWKKFRSIIMKVRERYLAEQNAQLVQRLKKADRTETERFWDTFEQMEKVSKVLSDCLNDHRRSKMEMHMLLMLHSGMLLPEDLVEFSDELQDRLMHFISRE